MSDEEHRERPGNRPVEQQERDPKQAKQGASERRSVSGPGAGDFLASGAGEDLPGVSTTKGMGATRGESDATNPRNLVPRLGPDDEAHPGERAPDSEQPGSATGTVGGGGPDAHNDSPVRATGEDDPTAKR